MEIIRLTHPIREWPGPAEDKVMALGYFDGVHIGHQNVIKTAVKIASEKSLKSAVMTFHPHPSVVLPRLAKRDDYLTPLTEKAAILEDLGVDLLYVVRFDQAFSRLSPQEFVDEYLIKLQVKHAVAGFDFTYGHMAKGTMETLPGHARNMFEVTVVPRIDLNGEKVSTTKIRELILQGRVREAADYLGRPYRMRGIVVHGDKRGKAVLGFPTANVRIQEPYVYPETGIYAVRMETAAGAYNGVGYIGKRPTFYEGDPPVSLEVFLLDFDGDLYGETVAVEWLEKIRDDQKFADAEALIEQMKRDVERAKALFANRYE